MSQSLDFKHVALSHDKITTHFYEGFFLTNLVDTHYKMFHAYQSSNYLGFLKEDF
jgi:hypothetical protein